ncbi:MAG TPA: hypothetical protein VFF44_06125 [Casimicrobiaceae bacterium]|nr:hypothetical protein [Casimicrobiaceae bacterium]
MRREVSPHEGADVAAGALSPGRWLLAAAVFVVLLTIAACDRAKTRAQEDAAIAAAVEKARLEDQEADRSLRERAIAHELARREAEQAEIDRETMRLEERQAAMARLEERLRAVLVDPSSMQIRNPRLSGDGATLCTEFNARNKQGVYLGFRRAVVSDTVLSLEQDPDDNYREPQHRFAEIARATGCY